MVSGLTINPSISRIHFKEFNNLFVQNYNLFTSNAASNLLKSDVKSHFESINNGNLK